jgi:predicted permease
MSKAVMWIAVILGIVFLALTVVYLLTPAGSLPSYFPGFARGSTHVHFKHGLVMLVLALAFFAFAWFQTGPKRA